MKNGNCLICERIKKIKDNNNPFFVLELETGYVVIGDFQFYKGYTLFLCKKHTGELHDLDKEFREKFLREMSLVSEAVFNAFKPLKLNYELLGNSDPHLHWHIFPRYTNDPTPDDPIWCFDKKTRYSDGARPSHEELTLLKQKLKEEIKKVINLS